MSIIFDYPMLIQHKYACPNNASFCHNNPFCSGEYDYTTVGNIICITMRAILLVEIPIYCTRIGYNFAEVSLCLVILQ